MTGPTSGAARRTVWLTAATALLVGGLLAGCSSSSSKAATPTLNPAFVKRGITLTVEPSAHPRSFKIPAGLLACAVAKLPAAAQQQVARVTNPDKIPGNVVVYVAHAVSACNRPFLLMSLERSMTDSQSGLGVGAGPAACASRKALVALLRLDPTKVAANTGNNAAVRAFDSSLDGCASFPAFVATALRQADPAITPAQLACIGSNTKTKTWSAMSAGEAAFQADLQRAARTCGLH
jgi:hypothetical protein